MLLNPALAFAAQQTHILHNEKPRPSRCAEVCAVCGDFSTGYHYEVPSCNGCKTFFRRTIVSERVFKCHKNGNCLFNKDIRCACRACRFKKCLEVGMNPKAIQCNRPSASLQVVSTETKNEDNKANVVAALAASEHAIRKRAYDISSLLGINEASCSGENENMHKLPSDVTDSDSRSGYCSSNGSPRPSKVSRSGTEYDQLIETLLMYEGRAEFLRNSDFEPSISLLDTMTKPCGLDDVSKYTARSRETINTPDYWLDMEITICLEYAKAFETYKNLSIADKCILINETCLASALISLTYSSFLRGSSTLTFPDGSPMQLAGLGSDYFTSQLLEPLTRLRADQVSVTLLKCIIFLHGEGYGLSEEGRLAILSRRERYYDALMTHVFAVHGPQKGPGEMCDLLALSWKYFNVAARIRDNICSGNTLYRQILDTCAVWRNE